jgi:ABC-type glycerol-3-phosphate transport system substrate-binding protein
MTPHRGKALALVIAAGLALGACGGDSEEPEATVSEDSSDSGELPGNDLSTVLDATNPEKEDYKEILDQVQEEAEESPTP